MGNKKVTFGARPSKASSPAATAEAWVDSGKADNEATKRFTIDVPVSLHRRIKMQCAARDVKMAEEIRLLLEKHFPEERS